MTEIALRNVIWLPPAEILLPDLPKGLRSRLEVVLMAGSKTFYLSKKVLEEYFGGVVFTAPTNVYLGLWTAALSDTSTGAAASEATYGSYARTQIGSANDQTTAFNAATGSTTATVTNKNAITCPTSTSGTNTITYVGVTDSATIAAGNMLVWADVASTVINSGDTPKVNASAMSVVED